MAASGINLFRMAEEANAKQLSKDYASALQLYVAILDALRNTENNFVRQQDITEDWVSATIYTYYWKCTMLILCVNTVTIDF